MADKVVEKVVIDEMQVKGNTSSINDGGKSFWQDSKGNFSSGRVIKVMSGAMAMGIAITGLIVLKSDPTNTVLADYCFKMAGLFLATATGSELVQKITGR